MLSPTPTDNTPAYRKIKMARYDNKVGRLKWLGMIIK
jgi:hypothetical protein